MARTATHATAFAGALLLSACFGSETPLGPPGGGTIDRSLVGSWRCVNPEDSAKVATLWVTPFDEHQYYVEWREDEDVSRYRAHSTLVRGRRLLNVEELATRSDKSAWVFLRPTIGSDGKLVLDLVDEEALAGKEGKSALADIKRRVEDEKLYSRFALCTVEP